MDKNLARDYLLEFSRAPVPEMIRRELEVPLDHKLAVSIVGPRRSGKTFYFFQLIQQVGKESALYLNFEDTRLHDTTFREIREIIGLYVELFGKSPAHVFLDEIQNVENWEAAVRELYDSSKYRILLTGSSSKLLSSEISTKMRGRSLTYHLLPFSFSEFLQARDIKTSGLTRDEESMVRSLLREYLEFGGFPDVVTSDLKEKILKEYFDAILFKDVVERHNVKNLHLVNLIFKQMVKSFAKEFSVNALYNTFKSQGAKVSKNTIYSYLNYFEDSVSVFFLKRHSEKARVKEAWPRKVYLSDMGFSKVLRSSENVGKLMENCVFLQLLREMNKRPLLDVDYYRDQRGAEVDFVIKEGTRVGELIQVTFASADDEIGEDEVKALIRVGKELRCRSFTGITWDYKGEKTIDGSRIAFIPLWEWLLIRK